MIEVINILLVKYTLAQLNSTLSLSDIFLNIVLGAIGSILAAVVLAILGALFRRKLQFVIRKIFYNFIFSGIEGFYSSQEEFESELDLLVKTSFSIKVLTYRGAKGCEFIFRNTGFLSNKKIEVLLANPYSPEGVNWINFREREIQNSGYYNKSTERDARQSYVDRTKSAIKEFCDLKLQLKKAQRSKKTVLNIYLYSQKPIWCLYMFDDVVYIGGFTEFDLGRLGSFYKVSRKSVLYRTSLRHFDYIKESNSIEYHPDL